MHQVINWLWSKRRLLFVSLLLLGGGWWWWQRRAGTPKPVTTQNPVVQSVSQTLEVAGHLDAHQKARLSFPAVAKLTWLGVKEGDLVKRWQAIAKVDTQTLEKQLQIDLNTHGKVYRTFEDDLDSVDYYSQSGLTDSERRSAETAQLDLRSAVLGVELRDLAIRLSSLTTPIAGLVTRIDQPNAGATILPTDLIEIVDPQTLYFAIIVDEEDVALVKLGQAAKITLDAYPEDPIIGEVVDIGFSAKTTEGGGTGYPVKISLPVDNQTYQFKLGMNGDAHIILAAKENVLTVPVNALITRDNQTSVEVKNGQTIETRNLEIGLEGEDVVEVISGLQSTDQVVIP